MIQELLRGCFFIFIAEMGDKTQILAMAFATKYPVKKVLLGVLIGSFFNHGIAVVLGAYMSSLIPLDLIRLIAACAFILFGLWTLRSEEEEEEEEKASKYGPVATVAMAFFIGELGDKTQLAAITLSTTATYPAFILAGTVLGMVITSSIGILVGSKLGKSIPEMTMKLISGGIFIFFGVVSLFETVPAQYITFVNILVFFLALAGIIYLVVAPLLEKKKKGESTLFQKTAQQLHEHIEKISDTVYDICLGKKHCGYCDKTKCMIGFLKEVMENINEEGVHIYPEKWNEVVDAKTKSYDIDKVINGVAVSVMVAKNMKKVQDKTFIANRAREIFEIISFGQSVPFNGDVAKYFERLKKLNLPIGEKIAKRYDRLQGL